MAKPKVKPLPPEDKFEARLRALWADYRPVFPDETFAEFIETAPLINHPEDDALCAAFALLPDDTRAAITDRLDANPPPFV